ncbi:unnamed protein product [Withania somnifera]
MLVVHGGTPTLVVVVDGGVAAALVVVVHDGSPLALVVVVYGGASLALGVVHGMGGIPLMADATPCNDVEYDPHESHPKDHKDSSYSPSQGSPPYAFSRTGPSHHSSNF